MKYLLLILLLVGCAAREQAPMLSYRHEVNGVTVKLHKAEKMLEIKSNCVGEKCDETYLDLAQMNVVKEEEPLGLFGILGAIIGGIIRIIIS